MAEAMKYAVHAGRLAHKAGRIPRKLYRDGKQPHRRHVVSSDPAFSSGLHAVA